MSETTENHKKLAEKALTHAAKEHGLELSGDVQEISEDEMPKRMPDYYVTLPSGVKLGVWEEPEQPPNE